MRCITRQPVSPSGIILVAIEFRREIPLMIRAPSGGLHDKNVPTREGFQVSYRKEFIGKCLHF